MSYDRQPIDSRLLIRKVADDHSRSAHPDSVLKLAAETIYFLMASEHGDIALAYLGVLRDKIVGRLLREAVSSGPEPSHRAAVEEERGTGLPEFGGEDLVPHRRCVLERRRSIGGNAYINRKRRIIDTPVHLTFLIAKTVVRKTTKGSTVVQCIIKPTAQYKKCT